MHDHIDLDTAPAPLREPLWVLAPAFGAAALNEHDPVGALPTVEGLRRTSARVLQGAAAFMGVPYSQAHATLWPDALSLVESGLVEVDEEGFETVTELRERVLAHLERSTIEERYQERDWFARISRPGMPHPQSVIANHTRWLAGVAIWLHLIEERGDLLAREEPVLRDRAEHRPEEEVTVLSALMGRLRRAGFWPWVYLLPGVDPLRPLKEVYVHCRGTRGAVTVIDCGSRGLDAPLTEHREGLMALRHAPEANPALGEDDPCLELPVGVWDEDDASRLPEPAEGEPPVVGEIDGLVAAIVADAGGARPGGSLGAW